MNIPEDNPSVQECAQKETNKKKSPRRKATIIIIWMIVCGGLLIWLIGAVQAAREAARCQTCHHQLKMLGLGLKAFDSSDKSLPPAYLCDEKGKPIHSWRALLMPYIGYYHWREAYSMKEPWDGPNNRKCHSWSFYGFHCPSVGHPPRSTIDYVAVVGPDTMWPGRERVRLPSNGGGNQDTILLIEMPDSDYRCLEPRFPTVEEFIEKIKSPTGKGIRCIHSKGLAYVTIGGVVRWFPPDTDPETIRRLFKRDPNCKVVSPEEKMEIIEHWEDYEEGK